MRLTLGHVWKAAVVFSAGFVLAAIGCADDTAPGRVCLDGESVCGNTCAELQTDPANCGACGTACPTGQLCSSGVCSFTCPSTTTTCNGGCVDVKVDPKNCGMCGNACSAGLICVAGSCAAQCPSKGQTLCIGDGGAIACVTTTSDSANCGMCGNVCSAGLVCSGGMCGNTCGAGETLCGGDGGAPSCAATDHDNGNCGSCGNVCTNGLVCVGGMCVGNCGAGEKLCPGQDGGTPYCAITQSDQANCGSCGNVCPSTQVCSTGTCQAQCGAGLTQCGSQCVDINSDRDNCGGCGKAVCSGATPICNGGKCGTCAMDDVAFGGHCYYLDGSGGVCDSGYARAPETAIAAVKSAGLWIGKNYKHTVSSNCCVWTSDAVENYGFGDHCNTNGPFTTNDPILGGAGCTNVMNHNSGQLTFCGTP